MTFFVLFAFLCPKDGVIAGAGPVRTTMTDALQAYWPYQARYREGLKCKEVAYEMITLQSRREGKE